MIEYYPWSEGVLEECLAGHDKGELATLDLDLTAQCTYASCIYCDSRPGVGQRHRNELNSRETKRLLADAKSLGLRWIFSCGLGEPLEDTGFVPLVENAWKRDIRISIFTNGIGIDREKARWLREHHVGLILKLDTFRESSFDSVLGKKGAARKVYQALEFLLEAGYGRDHDRGKGYTDLAFSIVPTSLTFDPQRGVNDLDEVIQFAVQHNVFPSVGELEQAGRVQDQTAFRGLSVTQENLRLLKDRVEELLWKGYSRPICPTIITGLHIDNVGDCIVDRETGLNCKWFMLEEPMSRILGSIRTYDLATLFASARAYRRERFQENTNGMQRCGSVVYTFGGCGGSPRRIVELARQHL